MAGKVRLVLYNDTLRVSAITSGTDTLEFAYDSAAALSGALSNCCRLDGTLGFSIVPYTWYRAGYDRYFSSRRDQGGNCRRQS